MLYLTQGVSPGFFLFFFFFIKRKLILCHCLFDGSFVGSSKTATAECRLLSMLCDWMSGSCISKLDSFNTITFYMHMAGRAH